MDEWLRLLIAVRARVGRSFASYVVIVLHLCLFLLDQEAHVEYVFHRATKAFWIDYEP